MGWCHEFGVTVQDDCAHLMTAGESSCHCRQCGVVCEGQFTGCATVWANGPREVVLARPDAQEAGPPPAPSLDHATEAVGLPPLLANGERRTVRTAWPLKEGQAMKVEPPAPAPEQVESQAETTPRRASDEARDQVFEWLQDSFEGLNSQIRVLSDAVSRQQQTLGTMTEAQAAAERLSQLADALPGRIGAAVQEAVTAGRHLGGVKGSAQGDPVEPSAPQSSAPQSSAPPETAPGVRTRLNTLASEVQARVNRSR
ncbi:MAG: hypothetical protein M3378_01330 [Actinomycetota bacterium]|nr:hypothetical protein [Actinomycetota bacterium]